LLLIRPNEHRCEIIESSCKFFFTRREKIRSFHENKDERDGEASAKLTSFVLSLFQLYLISKGISAAFPIVIFVFINIKMSKK
jgi:hypothetical protein